jgi:hypothetical protein
MNQNINIIRRNNYRQYLENYYYELADMQARNLAAVPKEEEELQLMSLILECENNRGHMLCGDEAA